MTTQVQNGKAFEYSCAYQLLLNLSKNQEVILEKNSSYYIARNFYEDLNKTKKRDLTKAAKAAIKTLKRLEPNLVNPISHEPLTISLQEDAKGQAGDVRDILFIRRNKGWEIGISIKHNHEAVKHSRLSQTIDFGEKWLGVGCSKEYFKEIRSIFDRLSELKKRCVKWSEMTDKVETVYMPLLEAFKSEIQRLDSNKEYHVPQKLLEYLLGRFDFYKIISNDDRRQTQILAFSLHSTLNKNAGDLRPEIRLNSVRMPSRIFDVYLEHGSQNTIMIVLDEGWQLSFRIHNASTYVEPSLKFDIKLKGQPNLYSHFESWD